MTDSQLDMSAQINSICRVTYMHLHNIGKIRHLLTKDSTATLVHAFVTSKLDHGTSLLYYCPENKLTRAQKLQNTSARLIANTKKYDHITPVLIDLHWLPVHTGIVFKICSLVYN